MKRTTILLLLCWLAVLRTYAQGTPPSDSVRMYLDNMFANVDKTQVPTPFLEEYGSRLAPLRLFNGVLQDSNRTTATTWRLLYASVLSSNINGPCNLPMLSDLNTTLNTQVAASSAIPVLVQRVNYAVLRSDAITAGLMTGQNEQLFDVAGRSQSPYQVRTLFAAAPSRSTVPTGNVSFIFTQALHVQSAGGAVSSISLDFGDGRGYLTATWGQPLTAGYTSAGTKRVKVRVTYNNLIFAPAKGKDSNKPLPPINQYVSYESHFDLEVLAPAVYGAARYDTDGFMQPFPAVSGVHSGGKVYVRFGGAQGSRTQLVNPLIVVEGYDPSSIAPEIQDNYGITDFLNAIATNAFTTSGSPFGTTLYNELQTGSTSSDIVFIDFNNGTDDIRRNAALFEEVVRWVNTSKQNGTSGQRNVVLGISMGGLVARYGLAEMEKRGNDPTYTRLLLTHDSPHRGANTPLGLQALTRQSAGTLAGQFIRTYNSSGLPVFFPKLALFPALQQADDLLDAPATQQLLLVRATRSLVGPIASFSHQYNSFIDNIYQPMVTPPAGGFPYEFKATSLGSQCGIGGVTPYSELVRIQGEGYMSIFLASTGLHTEIIVNAMPNSGRVERISGLRVWQHVRVLFFSHDIYLTRYDYHSPASNPVAWDGLPGGRQFINGQISLAPGAGSASWWQFPLPMFGYNYSVALANDFCFVPTASALDVPLNNITTRASYVSNTTTGPSQPTPVGFIANQTLGGQSNAAHPRFPARQAQWLLNEIRNQSSANVPLTCTAECNPYPVVPIVGPNVVCDNGSATYTVSPPFGGVVDWTASPAGLVTFTTPTVGANSVTIVPTASGSGFSGTITLTAQLSNGCYTTTTPARTIAVGQGFIVINDRQAPDVCASQSMVFTVTEAYGTQPNAQYTWQVNHGFIAVGQGTSQIQVSGLPNADYEIEVTVSAPSACPGSPIQTLFGQYVLYNPGTGVYCNPYRSAGPVMPTATLYPNPAKETVDVHVDNADAAHPVTVRLFDAYGRPRAEQISSGAAVRLATDKLPAGLYFVHILRGKEVLSRQQLRIEK